MAEDIKNLIFRQAEEIGVPPEIALAVAEQETNFDQSAIGTSGEHGVFQLMEGTASDLRVDRDDLMDNIRGGITYLSQMHAQTGESWENALKAYNGGIGNFKRNTVSNAAQGYAKSVLKKSEKYKTQGSTETFDQMAGNLDEYDKYLNTPVEEGEEAKAAPPAMGKKAPELNMNVPATPAGLSQVLLQRTNAPDFYELPFDEQAKAVSDIYKAKPWSKEAYPLFKETMNNLWDAADPDQLPDIKEIVGAPPISEEDPTKETAAWKTKVIQDLHAKGISPGVFGNKLDEYMAKASQDEIDAFGVRNQGFASRAASNVGNTIRDVAKGATAGIATPVAGIVRLGTGAYETADAIQNIPEMLGKPSNAYLYETKDDGHLKLDENNEPIPRWQSSISQTVGSVGAFLAGGVAVKAAGASTAAISKGFFTANALTVGNNIFKDVYEKTGSVQDAYVGSLFALPAAAVGSMGEAAVVSKFANPVMSALSPYNKVKYFSSVFARNAAVGAVSNAGLNALEQTGKISQTGEDFNTAELAQNAIAGGLASGVVGAAIARPAPAQKATGAGEPPLAVKGTTLEQQTAAANLEKFQVSPNQELVIPNSEAAKIHPEVLDTLGMTLTPNGNNTTITKRTSYVPFPVTEELTTLNKNIEELHYSLTKEGKPEDAFALSERLGNLKKEYADSTALLDDATVSAVRQRKALDTDVNNARITLDRQTDPTLKEVSRLELKDARAKLDAFDADNDFVYSELPLKVGELDSQIQETQARLENIRRGTFPNDVSAKQADLAAQIEKRKAVILKIEAEQAKAQPKPEGEPKAAPPQQSKEEIIQDAAPEVDAAEGVPVNGRNVIPVNGKWHALDKKGNPIGTGKDFYTDAVQEASGRKPVRAVEEPKGELPPLPEDPPILQKAEPDGSVGAKKATGLVPERTAERIRTAPSTDVLVKEALGGDEGITISPRQTHIQSKELASSYIAEKGGIAGATIDLLNTPDNVGTPELVFAARELRDYYNDLVTAQRKAGDIDRARASANLTLQIAQRISAMLKLSGQVVDAGKVFAELSPDVVITNINETLAKNKLPGLSEADEARIADLMATAKKTGGVVQQNLLAEVAGIELRATKGALNRGASPLFTLWQSLVLSDPSSQGVNLIGNSTSLAGSALSFLSTGLARGNLDGFSFLKGVTDSLGKGWNSAMLELRGIKSFKPDADKFGSEASQTLQTHTDFVKTAPKWMQKLGLNNAGYVLRALSAGDAFFYTTSKDGMARMMAYNLAKGEGVRGTTDLRVRIAEIMGNSTENWNKSAVKAKAEVAEYIKLNPKFADDAKGVARLEESRTWEISEQFQPREMRIESNRFAARSTFTGPSEGVAGIVTDTINYLANKPMTLKIPGKGNIEVRPFKYLFPFMSVAGKIANAMADYTPVGAVRTYAHEGMTALERRNTFGKFMMGSFLGYTLYGLAKDLQDDKDPYFAIYGPGPKGNAEKALWKESGGKPYSIKIGDQYVRYAETPLGLLLGGIGKLLDNERYDPAFKSADPVTKTLVGIGGSLQAFTDLSFLKSIGDTVKTITGSDQYLTDVQKAKKMTEILAINPIKGFINPGFVRAIAKLVDDPIDVKDSFYAKLISGTPLVERIGTRPSLNLLGKPIERDMKDRIAAVGRFFSERVDDPAIRWLAETGYVPPDDGTTTFAGPKAIKTKREEKLGAMFANHLTPDERYEVTKRAGPLIEKRILQYKDRYGNSAYSEKVQEDLKDDISKIRSKVRKNLALESIR